MHFTRGPLTRRCSQRTFTDIANLRGVSVRIVTRVIGCITSAVAIVVLLTFGDPAWAANFKCSSAFGASVTYECITVDATGNSVWGDAESYGTQSGYGFYNVTVAVSQCDGTGNNCGTIAARSDTSYTWQYFSPSSKPYSFGHTYKSQGSWTDALYPNTRYIGVNSPLAS